MASIDILSSRLGERDNGSEAMEEKTPHPPLSRSTGALIAEAVADGGRAATIDSSPPDGGGYVMVNDKDNSPSSATRIRRQVLAYSWLVAKNIVEWVLILALGRSAWPCLGREDCRCF